MRSGARDRETTGMGGKIRGSGLQEPPKQRPLPSDFTQGCFWFPDKGRGEKVKGVRDVPAFSELASGQQGRGCMLLAQSGLSCY